MTRRQVRIALVVAALLLVGLMALFAVELANSQSKARNDVVSRVRERARLSAALTESLFSAASGESQAQSAKLYGAARVTPQTMAAGARQGNQLYAVLLAPGGAIIAASPDTPLGARQALGNKPRYIRRVLTGQPYGLSDVLQFGTVKSLEYAQAFQTPFGRRVLVNGLNLRLIFAFLGGSLKEVPNVHGGGAYVLDSHGAVVASPAGKQLSQPVNEPGLTEVIARRDHGPFGRGRYFASSPVRGTTWKVVLTGPKDSLFASVSGTRKWVPWILFAAFGFAAAAALMLLARVLRSAAELSATNEQLAVTNRALERNATELTRSNAELEQFASIASHDLQEPLRKVQTFAEQLRLKEAERLSDQGRDYIRRTSDAAQRMQALVEDLLTFSRVATRPRPFVDVDLTETVHEAVADLEAVIEQSGATVKIGELPTVSADPLQMRQLLQNLVSNALKFRRERVPPEVHVKGRTVGRLAEIEVTDNGIGFNPKYSTRIFRVFERLHGRGTYPGTGIGLALCRKIAERHGGTIVADSTPGEGSTFTVTLPIEHSDEPPGAAAAGKPGQQEESPYVHA